MREENIFDYLAAREEQEFCEMVGLRGTFWDWLREHGNIDSLAEQLDAIVEQNQSPAAFIDKINTLADQAAQDNYASRRIVITGHQHKINIQIAAHPYTQRTIVQFLYDHIKNCDKDCELIEEAEYMIQEGYKVIPQLVAENVWTDTERLMLISRLDQLHALITHGTS